MKLSIFTTTTNPQYRGDNYREALACYRDLADEVIVVNGGGQVTNHLDVKYVNRKWPEDFSWQFIGEQFQRGYKACAGDWVIHADLDFIFHEQDFEAIRKACEANPDAPSLSLWKYQFILPDRYNLKSRLVVAVNKGKYGDRIRFDSGGDLAQPSLDGEYIKPDDVPEARVAFYNYEKLTKTKAQVVDDVERMDKAYFSHFGRYLYSNNERSAYDGWLEMVLGRYNKPSKQIKLSEHPRYIQETIKNLTPEQFGYNAFGNLERNSYV